MVHGALGIHVYSDVVVNVLNYMSIERSVLLVILSPSSQFVARDFCSNDTSCMDNSAIGLTESIYRTCTVVWKMRRGEEEDWHGPTSYAEA